MIQILFGIWLCLLKQSCREIYGEQFFFLHQSLKSFVKASKVSFKLFVEKKFKKKRKGDRRCWADPPPFRPSEAARPSFPSPLSHARRPPSSTRRRHVADVRRRRGRAAADRPLPGRDAAPRPQATPFCLPAPLSSSTPCEQQQQLRRRSTVRHWRRSPAPNSGHPCSIKPTPSSASTSATLCARSRPSASRY